MFGSPPHAWGIQVQEVLGPDESRFTPTCVGNTKHRSARNGGRTVHPHMRGEYTLTSLHLSHNAGSPPHAWGILNHMFAALDDGRFTPTCVGNTAKETFKEKLQPVHPHMRGEYVC